VRRIQRLERPGLRRRVAVFAATALAWGLASPVGLADEATPVDPTVELDQLLRLPQSFDPSVRKRSGASAGEWRSRFSEANAELEDASRALARAQKELSQMAGSGESWQVSAPGVTEPNDSPVSFRLRAEIRDSKERIAAAEKRLRALEIEANLANVPPEWRGEEPE